MADEKSPPSEELKPVGNIKAEKATTVMINEDEKIKAADARIKHKQEAISGAAKYEIRHNIFYNRDDDGGRIRLQCRAHLHYCIELLYLKTGKTVGYCDRDEYEIESGDIFIVFPNQIHRFESTGAEEYLLFIITPELMPELLHRFTAQTPKSALIKGVGGDGGGNAELNRELLRLLYKVKEYGEGGAPGGEVVFKGYLLSFFGLLLSRMSFEERQSGNLNAFREVVSYCSSHFTEDLSLDLLAEKLHISKYYISHMFSGKLNMRFNDYVNSLRVSAACRYLSDIGGENKSITEICGLVGFNTLRTFNRAFIRQLGMTPSAYRNGRKTGKLDAYYPLL